MPTIGQIVAFQQGETEVHGEEFILPTMFVSEVRLYVETREIGQRVANALMIVMGEMGFCPSDLHSDVSWPGVVVDMYDQTRV